MAATIKLTHYRSGSPSFASVMTFLATISVHADLIGSLLQRKRHWDAPRGNGRGVPRGSAALMNCCRRYAASWQALSVAMGSFEEVGAASGLQSLTNPASHKACRSALFITFRYSGVCLRPR
jgi:hypothetical protein